MVTDEDRKHVESLLQDLTKIQDIDLRKKVIEIWAEAWRDGNFEKPEDMNWLESWRHIFTWSNVDHTNQATAFAIGIAKLAQEIMGVEVNMDYLIAGALVHDVDKGVMYDGKTREETPIGKFLPHSAYSVYLALKHKLPIEIVHMISTHTSYSVKRQMTAEALILHMADYLTADLKNIKEGVDHFWSQEAPLYADMSGPPEKPKLKKK
jgi:7,8-dihydroneopterin 2',3'-cyclic phosphate phosphodiesterase